MKIDGINLLWAELRELRKDKARLDWLLSRLDGLAMDALADEPCAGFIMSPVDRGYLDGAMEKK